VRPFKRDGIHPGFRLRLAAKDGSIRWAELNSHRCFDPDGTSYARTAYCATSRSGAAEEALRASEERFRLLINTAIPLVVTSMADGRVLFVNETAAAFFGVPVAEAAGIQAVDFWCDPEARRRSSPR